MRKISNGFLPNESFLRAIYSPEMRPNFWEPDGTLSSAAFKDAAGLSVIRTYNRKMETCVQWVKDNYKGYVISLTLMSCLKLKVYPKYLPSRKNYYHCELWGSKETALIDDLQAIEIARNVKFEYCPNRDNLTKITMFFN